jgi:hypothetical protein
MLVHSRQLGTPNTEPHAKEPLIHREFSSHLIYRMARIDYPVRSLDSVLNRDLSMTISYEAALEAGAMGQPVRCPLRRKGVEPLDDSNLWFST